MYLLCFEIGDNELAFGNRAIYNKQGHIDYVPGKAKTVNVTDKTKSIELLKWLSNDGIKGIEKIIQKNRPGVMSMERFRFASKGYEVIATPNGSDGYLYIMGREAKEKNGTV